MGDLIQNGKNHNEKSQKAEKAMEPCGPGIAFPKYQDCFPPSILGSFLTATEAPSLTVNGCSMNYLRKLLTSQAALAKEAEPWTIR